MISLITSSTTDPVVRFDTVFNYKS